MTAKVTTSGAVFARLRKYYATTGYALLSEVSDSTGGRQRSVDALTMSLWPSKGLQLIGHEIKVSRSDWLQELKQAAKSQLIYRHCNRWYLVVGDEAIVKPGELPATWGLMVPRGAGLEIAVKAPLLAEAIPPGLDFIAAIMRRCAEQSVDEKLLKENEARVRSEMADANREALGRAEERHRKEVERLHAEMKRQLQVVEDFQDYVGERVLTNRFRRPDPWDLVKTAIAERKAQEGFDDIERKCRDVLRAIGRDKEQSHE